MRRSQRSGHPRTKSPGERCRSLACAAGVTRESHPIIALSPGAVGTGKAWPVRHYCDLAGMLAKDGSSVWVLGGPNETSIAKEIVAAGGNRVRDLTSTDLRNAILPSLRPIYR